MILRRKRVIRVSYLRLSELLGFNISHRLREIGKRRGRGLSWKNGEMGSGENRSSEHKVESASIWSVSRVQRSTEPLFDFQALT